MRLFIGPAKRTNWEVVPQLGYAIKEDMVIGLGIGYGASASETENAMDFEGNTFIIAPYTKKYISLSECFALNLHAEVSYATKDCESSGETSTAETFFIGLRPGVSYRMNPKFVLQAQIGSLG
jgi:hypothetical protein